MENVEVEGIWTGLEKVWAYNKAKVAEAIKTKNEDLNTGYYQPYETGCHDEFPGMYEEGFDKAFDIHLEGWLLLFRVNGKELESPIFVSCMISVEGSLPVPMLELRTYEMFKNLSSAYQGMDDVPFNTQHTHILRAKGSLWAHGDCMWMARGDSSGRGVQFVLSSVLGSIDIHKAKTHIWPDDFLSATGDKSIREQLGLSHMSPEPDTTGVMVYYHKPTKPPMVYQEAWDKLRPIPQGTISLYYWGYELTAEEMASRFSLIWKKLTSEPDKIFELSLADYWRCWRIFMNKQSRADETIDKHIENGDKLFPDKFRYYLETHKKSSPVYRSWNSWLIDYEVGRV